MTPSPSAGWLGLRASSVRIVDLLVAALMQGDAEAVRALLHTDVVAVVDGGGLVDAPLTPVRGATAFAQALVRNHPPDSVAEAVSINGSPAVMIRAGDAVVTAICVTDRGGVLTEVWVIRNPEKLRHWNRS